MDSLKNAVGLGGDKPAEGVQQGQSAQQGQGGGGFLGGLGDKINSAAGGGKESEKNEDYLDKGMLKSPSANALLPQISSSARATNETLPPQV